MTEPLCERCQRPAHDGAYVCAPCTAPVSRLLAQVAAVAGEATTTIARLDVLGDEGAGTPEPDIDPAPKSPYALTSTPLPVDLDAGDAHRAAVADLMAWARRVATDEDPVPAAQLHQVACTHQTCRAARAVRDPLPGPACPVPTPADHPLALVARWVRSRLEWLRRRADADEVLAGVEDACRAILAVVDRPAERWSLGPCGAKTMTGRCTLELRPITGAGSAWCQCGAEWDVATRKAELLELLDDTWLPATKAAHMLLRLGEDAANANTIRGWAKKGWLMAHPASLPGQPVYRLGSIRELIRIERKRKLLYAALAAERAEETRQREAKRKQRQETTA